MTPRHCGPSEQFEGSGHLLWKRADQMDPWADDDEWDDVAAVKPQVERTARAVHLRYDGNGITHPLRRRTFTRLSMKITQECGNRKGGGKSPPRPSGTLSLFHQSPVPHFFALLHELDDDPGDPIGYTIFL